MFKNKHLIYLPLVNEVILINSIPSMLSQPLGGTFSQMIYILSCLFGRKVVLLVPLLL